MQARTIISLTASVLITGAMVSTLMMTPKSAPQVGATSINGMRVVDLPGITVRPAPVHRHFTMRAHGRKAMSGAGLVLDNLTGKAAVQALGSPLSMPYYSFSSDLGQISKD